MTLRPMSPRLSFWFVCVLTFVAAETVVRLSLMAWVGYLHPEHTLPILVLLPVGFAADVAMGALLGSPFLIGLHLGRRYWRRRWMRVLAHLMLLVLCGALILIDISALFYWNDFDSRFDSIAVNYLMFPREVFGNIEESFNLTLFLPLAGVIAIVVYWFLRKRLDAALHAPTPPRERRTALAVGGALVVYAAIIMFFGPFKLAASREVNEIVANGLHSLVVAAFNNDSRYDGLYPGMPEKQARDRVRALIQQDNTEFVEDAAGKNPTLRRVKGTGALKRLNVVLVIQESFGSTYVDDLDNTRPEKISPHLTRIGKDGLFFTNVYATGNRTVRGLEALLTSFPPIPGISTSRRPGSKGMHSLAFLFDKLGYQTAFLYGGRALFDNMGPYWSGIGFEHVWDQGDIAEQPFTTAWGAADEYIFGEALKRMDAEAKSPEKPIFLSVLTVSNHRPYVYPEGRIDKDPARKRKENSATYADWAFGDFIERARGRPWFDDTVFIFVGDHGPRVYGAAVVPVPSYRVPLMYYAPKHIRPERNETLGSAMDMGPTLLGILGFDYESPFFGIDLKRVPPGTGRVAMEHNFAAAFGNGRHVATIRPNAPTLGYKMRPGPFDLEPEPSPEPDAAADAVALYQTAHRMFYAGRYHDAPSP